MGTSGAYGGSPGWSDTRRDTEGWLRGGGPATEGGSGNSDQVNQGTADGGADPGNPATQQPPSAPHALTNPAVARILAGVAAGLSSAIRGGSNVGVGRAAEASGRPRGRRGRPGGGRRTAAASAGAAITGVYGLRSRDDRALADVGLSLADLETLTPFDQAKRIVDAATGLGVPIEDDEIRQVNAEFVWRSLEHEGPQSPTDLVKAWVTELVFQTWLTESGAVLRDGNRDGATTHALEREVRATLEAAASGLDLPVESLRATDLGNAVSQLLSMLNRIFEGAVT